MAERKENEVEMHSLYKPHHFLGGTAIPPLANLVIVYPIAI